MTTKQTQRTWTRYIDERPKEAGLYEWRVPSSAVPGMVLIVAAAMRMRGAGFETVLSPEFDYWNGYSVLVQCDVEWRETEFVPQKYQSTPAVLAIEGLDLSPCSHCGKVPRIKARHASSMGGIVLNPSPWNLNTWRFSCCAWGETPSMYDPREIERIRRETRGKHVPELLDALKRCRFDTLNMSFDDMRAVRAAIAKATGEHP